MMHKQNSSGFTILEIIVVTSLIAALFGFIGVNLARITYSATINSQLSTIISDLKIQQVKSQGGDTEGRTTSDSYGIYFETNRYTFFHSLVYNQNDPDNLVVNLGDNMELTDIRFPSAMVVFREGSGELLNYVSGSDSVTLVNTQTNEEKTITLNRYGVVTGID